MSAPGLLASTILALLTIVLAAGGAAIIAHHAGYQRGWRAQAAGAQAARDRYQWAARAATLPAPRPLPHAQRDHQEVVLYLRPVKARGARDGRN